MQIFDVIPENFFSVLASPLKELYADVIFLIYDQYLRVNFGLKRDVIVDIIIDYLEEREEDENLQNALSDEMWEESLASIQELRERANFVIRKLEKTGWIMLETYSNYEEYINLTDYAIRLIDALDKIRSDYRAEYQGYVYATYSLLYSREADHQGHIALEKAYEQTRDLIQGLKSLQHNIKRYIERVIEEKEPQQILKLHFDEYKEEIIDRSYHRLKTSDNVSKYRPRILKKINEWYQNQEWVDRVAIANVRRDYFSDLDEARQGVLRQLDFIRQSYSSMDELLEEIDRRNTKYANTSFLQLKYLLNSSKDTAGQLMDIITYLADLLKEDEYSRESELPSPVAGLFEIYSQEFMDNSSLYTPRRLSRNHEPAEINQLEAVDETEKKKARERMRQEMASRMTRKRINRFVLDILKDRDSIRAKELEVEDLEDFLKLIYTAAYSGSKTVDYRVEFEGERYITRNGKFAYKDILIKRKKKLSGSNKEGVKPPHEIYRTI